MHLLTSSDGRSHSVGILFDPFSLPALFGTDIETRPTSTPRSYLLLRRLHLEQPR